MWRGLLLPRATVPVLVLTFVLAAEIHHVSSFSSIRSSTSSRLVSSSIKSAIESSATDSSGVSGSKSISSIVTDRSEAYASLQQHFDFPLDSWQLEAGSEILAGRSVIVSAPTGAGKTVVGEMGLWKAFNDGLNAIYTTPLKALSNQKFVELRKIFGPENVGLATGDMSINRGARITVMTTEVYRNMAWRASGSSTSEDDNDETEPDDNAYDDLVRNDVVVLDEFHYMGMPGRGGVWEECIITSPPHTTIIGLSATLPNANRLAQWMTSVTGRQTTLVEAAGGRPVPLRYLYASSDGLNSMFRDPDAGPGAPNGLLGLRGDGKPQQVHPDLKRKKKKGFSDKPEPHKERKFPKGLQVNPVLLQAIEKRLQKIDRRIQKQALQSRQEYGDEYGNPRQSRLSAREERKERDRMMRQEMRRSVPSLPFLVRRLDQKNLLPAIFFIFSRAGCDDAARFVRNDMKMKLKTRYKEINGGENEEENERRKGKRKSRQRGRGKRRDDSDQDWYTENESTASSPLAQDKAGRSFRPGSDHISDKTMASIASVLESDSPYVKDADDSDEGGSSMSQYADLGLLDFSAVKEVAARVASFNEENPELAFSEEEAECFMFGVGSHHAGMLAAHKAFVETLFKAQLMKVVFATETLAAGINMPARTTVVCSLAKRGDNSAMNLLETSNLLQMAGRAGRRGLDTEGTCAIVATPFEGPNEAQSILTSEIKPIKSQFAPSYSLATNLVTRGGGKLDVARGLVEKSFAMWEQQQNADALSEAKGSFDEDMEEVVQALAQEKFLDALKASLQSLLEKGQFDKPARQKSRVYAIIDVISNRKLLKKESKAYLGLARILELEVNTLKYLEREANAMDFPPDIGSDDSDILGDLFEEDLNNLESEMQTQKRRLKKCERDVNTHVFANMAGYANTVLAGDGMEAKAVQAALAEARVSSNFAEPISAEELSTFAKSATVVGRKKRKLATKGVGAESLLDSMSDIGSYEENTWQDMIALVNVLEAYGCISPQDEAVFDAQDQTYVLTQAGKNIGMLGFDNSLWCLVAMGGAWDVANESAELDDFRSAMKSFDDDDDDDDAEEEEEDQIDDDELDDTSEIVNEISKPQQESERLISLLRGLEAHELAGYVSCLVSEGSRGSSSVVESFMKLTPAQQPVIQSSLLALERLMDVQKRMSVDESSSRCQLDLSTCDVVTAWASGCSWSEALEISGSAPGDLARTLHRALDALRQLGNLPYSPVRATGQLPQTESFGIHPEIRKLCRSAAAAIDRYPVKDPLPFDDEQGEEIEPDEIPGEGVDDDEEDNASSSE